MGTQSARVLVVEDDEAIRCALGIALEAEGYGFRGEPDGTTLQRTCEEFQPDLAILDVRLPVGPDGYAIARRLRFSGDLPLLFLTVANTPADRLAGFAAGGDDYVAKPFVMDEVLARVNALLRRSGRLEAHEWRLGSLAIDRVTRTVTRGGRVVDLTAIEYDLLDVLARHHGKTLSKLQLLNQVWGFDAYRENVVEVHVSALRRKLEAHGPRLIHTIFKVGYVLRS